jgi:hypothetical protein
MHLKPVVDELGELECLRRWSIFCENGIGSPSYFAKNHEKFSKNGSSKKNSDGIKLPAYCKTQEVVNESAI